MALAANDKSQILRKLGVINTSGIVGGLDGDDGLAFRNDFVQIALLTEIPTNIVATGGCSTANFAKTMLFFPTQKTNLASPDVISQTNQGTHIVRSQQMVGDKDRTRHPLKQRFRS